MNRLFILTVGPLEVRGLISPGELPDVSYMFRKAAERKGAVTSQVSSRVFLAAKDDVVIRLEIQSYHSSIPSKTLEELLEEVLDQELQ